MLKPSDDLLICKMRLHEIGGRRGAEAASGAQWRCGCMRIRRARYRAQSGAAESGAAAVGSRYSIRAGSGPGGPWRTVGGPVPLGLRRPCRRGVAALDIPMGGYGVTDGRVVGSRLVGYKDTAWERYFPHLEI